MIRPPRHPLSRLLGLALVVASCRAAPSRGDGGDLRAWHQQGRAEIAVFTEPSPLVTGPVDVSVLLLDQTTGEPIRDARIIVAVAPKDDPGGWRHYPATEQAATNKLMHAAVFDLPSEGPYHVSITIAWPGDQAQVQFALDVGPSWSARAGIWPWILWPALAILFYGIHLYLIRQGRTKSSRFERPRAQRTAPDAGPEPGAGAVRWSERSGLPSDWHLVEDRHGGDLKH